MFRHTPRDKHPVNRGTGLCKSLRKIKPYPCRSSLWIDQLLDRDAWSSRELPIVSRIVRWHRRGRGWIVSFVMK